MWRAEPLKRGLEFDIFKPRLESCIFIYISWLNIFFFLWVIIIVFESGSWDLSNGTKVASKPCHFFFYFRIYGLWLHTPQQPILYVRYCIGKSEGTEAPPAAGVGCCGFHPVSRGRGKNLSILTKTGATRLWNCESTRQVTPINKHLSDWHVFLVKHHFRFAFGWSNTSLFFFCSTTYDALNRSL